MRKVIKTWKNISKPESLVLMSDDYFLFVAMDCASEEGISERVILSECVPTVENEQIDVFVFLLDGVGKNVCLAIKKEPDGTRRLLFECEFAVDVGIWLIESAVVFVTGLAVHQMIFQNEMLDLMQVRAFSSIDGRELSCHLSEMKSGVEIFVNAYGNLFVFGRETSRQYGVRGDSLVEIPYAEDDWRAQLHNYWGNAADLGFCPKEIVSQFEECVSRKESD